ncbi:LOW QUALITY PROTEIN: ubiquitin carboxyl-terminal hydrolase isozyme L3-like [Gigantopelta aegis]|uniref:LOW QUALITY PROTEIN: ubiquitin carboxyl-terminal hydrolase isozyme L3-like n=1 Tax=Gigantopelta aegis TaxID=1735272 RepID=UPI001B887C36|nr:LOW QUALITY PROTEIN: ubiquitin carboxyl-terminal hydrolase isozyme L3-like [Gigantopelta aegis]
MAEKPRWLPLEANPEVMNKYIKGLGVEDSFQFCDVYGLDPDLLAMVPQPCTAVVMLFPVTDQSKYLYETHREEEEEKIKKEGQTVSPNVYYMKQYVGNACGTVGLLHTLCNNMSTLSVKDGYLKNFFEKTKAMSPEERGRFLEQDEREDHTNLHFVAIVYQDGYLYELGKDAANVCQKFMIRDPDEIHFTIVALAAAQ